MDTPANDIYEAIRAHISGFWPESPKEVFSWKEPIVRAAFPNLRMCKISPVDVDEPWVYVSMGIWEAMADEEISYEFFILSPVESLIHLSTLAVLSIYHRDFGLQPGRVIEIGREWLEGSAMHHFLVSLPYPYGPELEICHVSDSRHVRFLWLLPITEQEAEFANQFGVEALEQKFDEHEINCVDEKRKSVV